MIGVAGVTEYLSPVSHCACCPYCSLSTSLYTTHRAHPLYRSPSTPLYTRGCFEEISFSPISPRLSPIHCSLHHSPRILPISLSIHFSLHHDLHIPNQHRVRNGCHLGRAYHMPHAWLLSTHRGRCAAPKGLSSSPFGHWKRALLAELC